jgi:vacuolar protein sorting-associated protein VTA1
MLIPMNKFKADNATNELVTDEVASQAYVEQFGLETFQRADNAVRANKASRFTSNFPCALLRN